MKKSAISALLLLSATAALAVPGKVTQLDAMGIDVLRTLAANEDDFRELLKHGKTVVEATQQPLKPGVVLYRVTARNCANRPMLYCVGGATLSIERKEVPTLPPHFEYRTRIDLLR